MSANTYPRSRARSLAREACALFLLALTWAVAVAATLWVAANTKLGSVVVRISDRHGVHEGDLLAGALFAGFAVGLSVMLVRWSRD